MKLPIVIPSLEPDSRLPSYCRDLRAKLDQPIVLVDDGSGERYKAIFRECCETVSNLVVLTHEVNRGKGRALKTAFSWLMANQPDLDGCITVDSDGQHLVKDVVRCFETSEKSPSALVLGCRVFTGSHVPWKSSFGNNWMKFLFMVVTGRRFMDTQTGLRVIPTAFMRQLIRLPGERFEFETEMLLNMDRMPLVQVPIETVYEEGNKSTHFRPLADSWKVVRVILKSGLRRFGLFVLSSLSSFVIDAGLFFVLYEKLFDAHTRGRLWWAILLARTVSMVYNYLVNEVIVFKVRFCDGGLKAEIRRFYKYLGLAMVIFLGAYLLTKVLCALLPSLPVTVLKVFADLLLFVFGYMVQRVMIFRS